jgi:hypothetical protein
MRKKEMNKEKVMTTRRNRRERERDANKDIPSESKKGGERGGGEVPPSGTSQDDRSSLTILPLTFQVPQNTSMVLDKTSVLLLVVIVKIPQLQDGEMKFKEWAPKKNQVN